MQNRKRVVIDDVSPQINGGEFFIKRVVNEIVIVNAHVLGDGHDVIAASVLYKHESEKKWNETRLYPIVNDEWQTSFIVKKQGFYGGATGFGGSSSGSPGDDSNPNNPRFNTKSSDQCQNPNYFNH